MSSVSAGWASFNPRRYGSDDTELRKRVLIGFAINGTTKTRTGIWSPLSALIVTVADSMWLILGEDSPNAVSMILSVLSISKCKRSANSVVMNDRWAPSSIKIFASAQFPPFETFDTAVFSSVFDLEVLFECSMEDLDVDDVLVVPVDLSLRSVLHVKGVKGVALAFRVDAELSDLE